MMWKNVLIFFLTLGIKLGASQRDCSRNEYDRCVRIADPLVKEAHLVFPDNMKDINLVCTQWNTFVDCLKDFTDNCFTDQQRLQFNRAVESPIESIHQMCMQPNYQQEYLQHAPCIKSTVIEKDRCGPHYNLLVDHVEQGDIISKSTLCCSHDRFKQCVLKETRKLCDRGVSDGPATRFASQVIDKALRFLEEQCVNYIPNSGDCVLSQDSLISYSDRSYPPSVISTASSEVYPWSTLRHDFGPKEIASPRIPKLSTSNTWSPSTTFPHSRNSENSVGPDAVLTTQHLGTRTRPGSYGRSHSWSQNPVSTSTPASTSPMFPSTHNFKQYGSTASWDLYPRRNNRPIAPGVSATPPYKPTEHSSSTTSTFDSPRSPAWNPSTSTEETWYPAAGNQLTNEVDEPNQLGLQKLKNGGCGVKRSIFSSLVFLALYYSI